MKWTAGATALLLLIPALAACGSQEDPGSPPAGERDGVHVRATHEVMVSRSPLGDVVEGTLARGQAATALCFVRDAQSSAGFRGSAIKVRAGQLTGYAAVTDFPRQPAERQALFDLDEDALQSRLPACSD